jgi:hypothetical protein
MKTHPFAKTCPLAALCLLVSLLAAPPAWSQAIYRCVDADDHPTFTNVPKPNDKNCTRTKLEPETILPAPRTSSRTPGAASNPTPAGFPKVSNEDQKAKDNDRRAILNQELANEQKALEQARKDLTEQKAVRLGNEQNYQKTLDRLQPYEDQVAQHERNIEALNKEIANLR